MDSPGRSLVKALCWNLLGLMSMSLVGLAMAGSMAVGGAMALINTVLGFTLYLFYERMWARIG